MGHGLLAVYMCSTRYGNSYPCSAIQYYSTWIILPIAIVVGLFTHQGYRYQRRRRSSFSGDDSVQGEALVASSRREVGLSGDDPGPTAHLPVTTGFAPPAPSAAPPATGPATGGTRPPGWYADPDRPGQQRYWYGDTWAPSLPPGQAPGQERCRG